MILKKIKLVGQSVVTWTNGIGYSRASITSRCCSVKVGGVGGMQQILNISLVFFM